MQIGEIVPDEEIKCERLSVKKAYKMLLLLGVAKPRAMFMAVRGCKCYTFGSIKKLPQ